MTDGLTFRDRSHWRSLFFIRRELCDDPRGGHIDLTVLGAFEVDQQGNIASWMIRESKILKQCTLPLTGVHCVRKIVTDLALLEVKDGASFTKAMGNYSAHSRCNQ